MHEMTPWLHWFCCINIRHIHIIQLLNAPSFLQNVLCNFINIASANWIPASLRLCADEQWCIIYIALLLLHCNCISRDFVSIQQTSILQYPNMLPFSLHHTPVSYRFCISFFESINSIRHAFYQSNPISFIGFGYRTNVSFHVDQRTECWHWH